MEKKKTRDELVEQVKRRIENPLCDIVITTVSEISETEQEIDFWSTHTLIDELTGCGLSKDSLTVIIGGTGDGKSLLLAHLASKMSTENKILYVSFENTSKVDASRFRDCETIYSNANHKNITYFNVLDNEMSEKVRWDNKYMQNLINDSNYDIICIDAIQTTVDTVDQDEIHRVGNSMMKDLYKLVLATHKPMIVTWQAARTAAGKKLENITLDDISGSVGTVRYCTNAFFIKREDGSRKLKLLKARESKEARWDNPVVDLEMSLRFSVEKIF